MDSERVIHSGLGFGAVSVFSVLALQAMVLQVDGIDVGTETSTPMVRSQAVSVLNTDLSTSRDIDITTIAIAPLDDIVIGTDRTISWTLSLDPKRYVGKIDVWITQEERVLGGIINEWADDHTKTVWKGTAYVDRGIMSVAEVGCGYQIWVGVLDPSSSQSASIDELLPTTVSAGSSEPFCIVIN